MIDRWRLFFLSQRNAHVKIKRVCVHNCGTTLLERMRLKLTTTLATHLTCRSVDLVSCVRLHMVHVVCQVKLHVDHPFCVVGVQTS